MKTLPSLADSNSYSIFSSSFNAATQKNSDRVLFPSFPSSVQLNPAGGTEVGKADFNLVTVIPLSLPSSAAEGDLVHEHNVRSLLFFFFFFLVAGLAAIFNGDGTPA